MKSGVRKDKQSPTWIPDTPAQQKLLKRLEGVEADELGRRSPNAEGSGQREPPRLWSMIGQQLHSWQSEARRRWFAAGGRGTIKVVTGAGKTTLALAIAEELQREREPDLRVVVVVPTIVLLYQWHDVIVRGSNLPQEWIGRLGGGHKDDLSGETRILITVLATARRRLPQIVLNSGYSDKTLIVADECHRLGAQQSERIVETPAAYRLGLSATPERTDIEGHGGPSVAYSETPVGRWLGPIVYELNYSEAIEQEVLPPFELLHYGLSLTPAERKKYDDLSRSINEVRDRLGHLSSTARSLSGERLAAWCRRMAPQQGELGRVAAAFIGQTSERKRLLYGAEARRESARLLVKRFQDESPNSRIILFHESISEVERLFETFCDDGVAAVMEHSDLPERVRRKSVEAFRSGRFNVVVSARSLVEGFNVPSADVGVVVASSSSPRQRIQSIGRVLRRYEGEADGGRSKLARVCVFYIRDTVDEVIYEKLDWSTFTGVERNRYFVWDPPDEAIRVPGPPRERVPEDFQIEAAILAEGQPYPGRYEGVEYSADTSGNVRDSRGLIAANPQAIPSKMIAFRGEAGKFKVTNRERHVLVLRRASGGWETLFLGRLEEPFHFDAEGGIQAPRNQIPGEPYSGSRRAVETLRFSQRANGTIVKRVRGGEFLARGPRADALIKRLKELEARFGRIARFEVNAGGDAYWTVDGLPRFIAAEANLLEFPADDAAGSSAQNASRVQKDHGETDP